MSKSTLITGASQGLGLELLREAKKRGYKIFALDINISDELKSIIGDENYAFECDITDYNAVSHCRKKIESKTDSIDILFNNAGIWLDDKRMKLDDENFDFDIIFKQYDVNAVGVLRIVREFIGMIKKSFGKTVINLSSEAGSIENCYRDGEYGYCMSKAAQNMASRIMQNAYPDIKFYSVHPGWMRTPQGMRGASGDNEPQQNAADTAKCLFDIAETHKADYSYCDFNGNKIPY